MVDPSPPSPDPVGGAAPETDPLVGTVLAGKYRIVRRLGAGAMGSVYLGEHLRFGRMDAIKVLQAGIAHDADSTGRFLRGARNASAINHPNVCTVYDFGDTDEGHQFLAMEFVDGVSLADILETEGPLPLRRGLEITRQIGEALDAAHHLGIVHRDLKPGNVMVVEGRDGRDIVKVVDFDIAKGTSEGEGSEVTRTGFVVGTPEYMSPEQLTGDPLDGRSDVYSLALVFVRIVTGLLPVRSTTTQNLMVERLTQDPLRMSELAPALLVPEGVQNAVDHALQRRREDRPPNAAAFIAALVRGARSGPAEPAPVGRPTGPSTATPAGPGQVPATQVGAQPAGKAAPAPAASTSPLRRFAPLAVAAVVLAGVGFGVFRLATRDAPAPPLGGLETTATPEDPGEAQPPQTSGDAERQTTATPPPPPVDSTPARPAEGETLPVDAADTPASPAADPAPPVLDAAGARALLDRQLGSLEPATFATVTDSASQVWDRSDLPDGVRAFAAYVLAQRFGEAGEGAEARRWAQRAVDLDPDDDSYREFLRMLGGDA